MSEEWEHDQEEEENEGIPEEEFNQNLADAFGFHYDPVFIPNGIKKTYAQISTNIKNKISHRAIAIDKLKKFLKKIN